MFGVQGERLEGVDGSVSTQDFYFNNAPMSVLTDVKQHWALWSFVRSTLMISGFEPAFEASNKCYQAARAYDAAKYQRHLTLLFYAVGVHVGEYYGHTALFPALELQTEKSKEKAEKDQPFGIFSDWLMDYFEGGSAQYEVKTSYSVNYHPKNTSALGLWNAKMAGGGPLVQVQRVNACSFLFLEVLLSGLLEELAAVDVSRRSLSEDCI